MFTCKDHKLNTSESPAIVSVSMCAYISCKANILALVRMRRKSS